MARIAIVAALLSMTLGCAANTVELCRKAARCADEDPSDCADDARAGNEDAAEVGCGSEHQRLAGCLERHGSCDDGVWVTDAGACDEEFQDELACFFDAAF